LKAPRSRCSHSFPNRSAVPNDGRDQHAGRGDQRSAGLGTELEGVGQAAVDSSAAAGTELGEVRYRAGVVGWEATSDIDGGSWGMFGQLVEL
jgi:hypothetical protein